MRKYTALLTALFFSVGAVQPAFAQVTKKTDQRILERYTEQFINKKKEKRVVRNISLDKVEDRRIIIKLKEDGIFSARQLQCEEIEVSAALYKRDYRVIRVPEHMDFHEKLAQIQSHPSVESAGPDYVIEKSGTASSFYPSQWYYNKLRMGDALGVVSGLREVKVAVMDTGVNYNHMDLKERVLHTGKISDFINGDTDPMDDQGHGTFVAGIIAMSPNVKILPVKVLGATGGGSSFAALQGLAYAMEQNVDVINMSYGAYDSFGPEEALINEAYQKGILLVAAAGNDNTSAGHYPSGYTPVISVSATDSNDQKADFSNWGKDIDIAAPGKNVTSTNLYEGHTAGSGTSYAAPMVSAVAALVKGKNPQWTPKQIQYVLGKSADRSASSLWNDFLGYGRVNAYGAVAFHASGFPQDTYSNVSSAKLLYPNQPVEERFEMPMDEDWFAFDVVQPSVVDISLTNVPTMSDARLVLYQKDAAGNLIYRKLLDRYDQGEEEQGRFFLQSGRYYIQVKDGLGKWSDQYYRLGIAMEPSEISTEVNVIEAEPNNVEEDADGIALGEVVAGLLKSWEMRIYIQ